MITHIHGIIVQEHTRSWALKLLFIKEWTERWVKLYGKASLVALLQQRRTPRA